MLGYGGKLLTECFGLVIVAVYLVIEGAKCSVVEVLLNYYFLTVQQSSFFSDGNGNEASVHDFLSGLDIKSEVWIGLHQSSPVDRFHWM